MLGVALLGLVVSPVYAQSGGPARMDLYGYIMTDAGYNVDQIAPDWYDTMRPTKLPSFNNQYGSDGNTYFSVRQTRFGVKGYSPTALGELKTVFEFELFGTGVDAGQTTFRLRHAYGQMGRFTVGQTWSPFMDIDVFPNSNEYWGPNGMVFFRNIQICFTPVQTDTRRFSIALERPGASGDQGAYADRVELQDITARFPLPDLSAEYRITGNRRYIELAGIVRKIEWEDTNPDSLDLEGSATGWGFSLSSNIKVAEKDVIKFQAGYGEAIENYMNDAPADIGIQVNSGSTFRPIEGVVIPVFGLVAFYDHYWNDRYSSSIGYSRCDIDNVDGQADDAFDVGQYGLVNLNHYPTENVMVGAELQWGKRDNFRDNFSSDDFKVQFSFRYNFSNSI